MPGLVVSTQTQTHITGGPPGNNTTETDVSWQDVSGNGWQVGMLPAYGGALVSPWYEISSGGVLVPAGNAQGGSQTSLATSNPDGFMHVLAQSAAAVFTGSEDPTYTLTEIGPPVGSSFRRWYDSGLLSPSTGPALQYQVKTCIYPGDPGFLVMRIDVTNPSGSAVTLAGSDSLEIATPGGLQQAQTNIWAPASGKYALVGGAETAWPTALTTVNPDYFYILPPTGILTGVITVKKTGLAEVTGGTSNQIQYLQNANRLKLKLQQTKASFAGSTTYTLYYLFCLRRNLASATADANSIAADYINADSPTMADGTFTSFSYDDGAYAFASTTGNSVAFTQTINSPVVKRWLCVYKITNWTARAISLVSLGGSALVNDTDYISYVDLANQTAYVKLFKGLVASGASGSELNNAQVAIQGANPDYSGDFASSGRGFGGLNN